MAQGNNLTLVGNLTDDPELRFTSGGQAMVRFSIAVNRRWQNRQTQEWEEDTSFFNVTAWREMAENVANSLKKGTRVIVTGSLRQRSWETEDGQRRSTIDVNADEIGPSLRWATAEVVRRPRRDEQSMDSGRSPAPQGASAGGGMPEEQPWEDEPAF